MGGITIKKHEPLFTEWCKKNKIKNWDMKISVDESQKVTLTHLITDKGEFSVEEIAKEMGSPIVTITNI